MLYQAKLKEDKGLVKIFECIISGFEVGKQTEAELSKLQESAHLKGFRKGKAPMSVIQDAYFGKVYFDIVNKEANKCIFEISQENKFNLASSPKVELDAESSLPADRNTANIRDITITITYETFPEIPAFDFSKISLEKVSANITDSDLEEELSKLAKNMATTEAKTEGAIENGDVAIIDFAGYESGIAFQGGTATDYRLEIGSKSFIEGFEEGVVGAKIGEA
jgi:trigger factor